MPDDPTMKGWKYELLPRIAMLCDWKKRYEDYRAGYDKVFGCGRPFHRFGVDELCEVCGKPKEATGGKPE